MWGAGGVAFINPSKEKEKKYWTKCRIWNITRDQYEEIWKQEGKRNYSEEIILGKKRGIPIIAIMNPNILTNILPPSESYLKTIIEGLKETYDLDNNSILSYLIDKEGIRNHYSEHQLNTIIKEVQ
jgi:hypothetical protein